MKKALIALLSATLILSSLAACSKNNNGAGNSSSTGSSSNAESATNTSVYKDGTYTAEFSDKRAEDEHGWRDRLVIKVTGGVPALEDYDSFNLEDNRRKSTDESYSMTAEANGTEPSIFIPQLIENWNAAGGDPAKIEAAAGATNSSDAIKELTHTALDAAKRGDETVQAID